MDQKEVWDKIAVSWKTFKITPIKEVIDFLKNKKGNVLDLGCGSGRNFTKINGITYGVDFSENMLRYAEEHAREKNIDVKLIKSDVISLPFKNNFFDQAIFVATLHCVPSSKKRKQALRELLRIIKPKARALITVWDYNQPRFRNKRKESLLPWKYKNKKYMRYYYLYDKEEIVNLLKKVGFKIVKVYDKKDSSGYYSRKNIIVIIEKS